ncbi:MAG: RNA polymerase factor sigma-54 [Methylacidiphilales bacterium]|nr:RNA polymerase factor sigma-54 [Candidatus Methylacidiphilales bacterium]
MSGIGLQQNFSLSQTLSPQMQQSLHFLQAPSLELRSLVQQELQANPTLEEKVEEPEDKEDEWDDEINEIRKMDEDWREYFSQNNRPNTPTSELQKRRQFLFDSQVEQETLSDHLISQLMLSTENEDILRAAETIIGNLNENGYLTVPLDEIATSARVTPEQAQTALTLIQSFHPPGVGARDLSETLLIQLAQRGRGESLETELIRNDLERLGRKRYLELSRHYKVPTERIQEAAEYIGRLQPHPGASYSADLPQNVVQPEAAFVKVGNTWTAQLNDDPIPRLKISDTYKDLMGQNLGDKNLKEYLRERIRAGKFLIKCLYQRQQTIENILNEIAKRQEDFFENGIGNLKPLTMNQVAEAVGVHETTVSRAASNKYAQTPWGVFPIKFFFTSGYTTSEGETMANTSIKDSISALIDRENPHKPLSDSEIVDILKDRGIEMARRTVAKYRAELGILPSNLRRQL